MHQLVYAQIKLSSFHDACSNGFWEKSMKPMEELTTAELTPLPEPERSLRSAINKMVEANNADRKKLDWQVRVYVKVP